jgi:hypothetical protein
MKTAKTSGERDGARDFDFLIGRWKVRNRRLRARLGGSTEWDEFESSSTTRALWGGDANLEEYEGNGPNGPIHGLALRLYDPRARQWSISWAARTTGVLEKPMIGEFRDGRGDFYDQEMFEGRSIFVRLRWSDITPTSCRWEQAFSPDGGETWETNWTMEFTRVA